MKELFNSSFQTKECMEESFEKESLNERVLIKTDPFFSIFGIENENLRYGIAKWECD